MDDSQVYLEDPKKYLRQIRLAEEKIHSLRIDAQMLLDIATKITPVLKDGALSGGGTDRGRTENVIIKLADYDKEISEQTEKLIDLKREICSVIYEVSDPDRIRVLHSRYVELKSFEQISVEMSMTYRNVCYIHGKGLLDVGNILSERKLKKYERNED